MKKTSVYLPPELTWRIQRMAAHQGRAQAEVIRAALEAYTEALPDRSFALAGSGRGPGGSVADVPDDQLLAGFGE